MFVSNHEQTHLDNSMGKLLEDFEFCCNHSYLKSSILGNALLPRVRQVKNDLY